MQMSILAVTLLLAPSAVLGLQRTDAPVWCAFMIGQYSHTDGATALYESMRRQAERGR